MRRILSPRGIGAFPSHLFFALSSNVGYAFSQAAMLVVLAKFGTPAMVGQFGLGLALTTPVLLLSKLQLRSAIVTDTECEYSFADYARLRLLATAAAMMVVACLLAAVAPTTDTIQVVLAVGLVKAIEGASDLCGGILQKHGQWRKIAGLACIKGAIAPLALWAGLWWFASPAAGLFCVAGCYVVVLALWESRWVRSIVSFEPKPGSAAGGLPLRRLLGLTLPLGIVATLLSLNVNLPRYVVSVHLGVEALGYYTALTHLMVTGNTVVQALGQAALSSLARSHASGGRELFLRLLGYLLLAALMVGLVCLGAALIFGAEILALVYDNNYADYSNVLVWLSVGALLTYLSSVLGYALTAARLFRVQVPLYSAAAAVCLIGSLAWVPSWGLTGAAFATIAGWATAAAGSAAVLLRSRRQPEAGRLAEA